MNLEGLEMIAVLVVVVLFVKVLEQFGLLETGYDGKEKGEMWGTDKEHTHYQEIKIGRAHV